MMMYFYKMMIMMMMIMMMMMMTIDLRANPAIAGPFWGPMHKQS
jgi:hypothetical protein